MMKAYQLGCYEKAIRKTLTWEEKLTFAKEAGYDFLEISIDETDEKIARLDWTDRERAELNELMIKTGLPIRSMCLSGHRKYALGSRDPQAEAKGMEMMEKAIKLSSDLGIRIIQLAGYDVYYEEGDAETEKRFSDNIKRSTEMAAAYGIVMGFETMENEFMNTVAKAMEYVDRVNSPYLGVYPDSGNCTNAAVLHGTDVFADFESGRGHLVAVHLKETVPGRFREIPFGTGHVQFEKIINTSWELGVRRFVTELWDVGKDTWKEDIFAARKMMGDILDKVSSN